MQAVLEKEIKKVSTDNTQSVKILLAELNIAEAKRRNEIENELVKIGKTALPELVECLQNLKGSARGVVAMILIRIGQASISYLENLAKANKDFVWLADYLISEIKGVTRKVA